jgi:hypothetical protein
MNAPTPKRRRWPKILAAFLLLGLTGTIYVWSNPLVFNESFWGHAHCIKIALLELEFYAEQHNGQYPTHPLGYGNALLLLPEECYYGLTGPGYYETPFEQAKKHGMPLEEKDCGRVYIQGLNKKLPNTIAILFDKRSTPGGDHCHFLARMFAPLGREVLFVHGNQKFIPDTEWPAFVQTQVALLSAAGIPAAEAQRLYDSVATP